MGQLYDPEIDPGLGGLDEEVRQLRRIEEDANNTEKQRFQAAIAADAIAHCVLVLAGKVVGVVMVAVILARSTRRAVIATAAVTAATGGAVAVTGVLATMPDRTPVPVESAQVAPAVPHQRKNAADQATSTATTETPPPPPAGTAGPAHGKAPRSAAGAAATPPIADRPSGSPTHASRQAAAPVTSDAPVIAPVHTRPAPTTTAPRATTPAPTKTHTQPRPTPTRTRPQQLPTAPVQTKGGGVTITLPPVLPSLLPSLLPPSLHLPIRLPPIL